jgi:hypothetical protein
MKWNDVVVVCLLVTAVGSADSQSLTKDQMALQKTAGREHWTDPDTGLMWAGRDSGKDVSWKAAVKYCRDLRLAGYSDWRLADMFELQGIYDRTAEAPGLAGRHSQEPTTWHVKGNLFLTAYEWSNSYRKDDRGHFSGYVYYFDFNEGKSNDDPTGWPYPFSALCTWFRRSVRRTT